MPESPVRHPLPFAIRKGAASSRAASGGVVYAQDCDIWVDIGTDEAALDAVGAPSAASPWWTWRVVPDANLRLQRAAGLLEGTVWEDVGEPFTAAEQTWTLDEPFDGTGARFYRLIWRKE